MEFTRRKFLLTLAALAVFSGFVRASATARVRRKDVMRPNVLVICVDDQTASSVWAQQAVSTRLKAQGTTLRNAYTATPICGPARASLLTGQFPHNHGVTFTGTATQDMRNCEGRTIAARLKRAGYATGFFGKYNNGYEGPRIPEGWDRWFAMTEPFNREEAYTFSSNGEAKTYQRDEDNETDVISNNAEMFIRNKRDEEPWFAYVCPHDPHGPYYPAPRHKDEFRGETYDPASEGEEDLSDKPMRIRQEPTYTDVEEAQNESAYRGALRELQAVDDLVKNLLDALEDTNQLEDTLIIYISDNGYLFGEHRLEKKNLPYDEACRVPFIVRGPGVDRGYVSNALASQVDLAPTICEAAGADASRFDGRSLWPILRGDETFDWRSCLQIEDQAAGWHALRTPGWWYSEWDSGETELYDIRPTKDPEMMRSVHDENGERVDELSRILATLKNS